MESYIFPCFFLNEVRQFTGSGYKKFQFLPPNDNEKGETILFKNRG